MDIIKKINKKIKELEDEIEDMKGSSPIILVIPKAQLQVLKEIINSKPQASPCLVCGGDGNFYTPEGKLTSICNKCNGTGKAQSDNSDFTKDCYNPTCSKRVMNNKCINGKKHCMSRLSRNPS